MLMPRNPAETYRKVDFDARVEGADPQALVLVCYETLVASLGTALFAHERGDNRSKSAAITRALGAMTALQLGIRGEDGVAHALRQFLEAARRSLLDSAVTLEPQRIRVMRQDFQEIAAAMTAATSQPAIA